VLRGVVIERPVIAMEAMQTGAPIAVSDAVNDERIAPEFRKAGFGPVLFVPLGAADQALGTLVVGRLAGRTEFGDAVLQLAESFAGQAAIALRLSRAAHDREQLAVLGDRDRIARDLHDLVIQRLFATGMSLEGSVRGMPPDKAERVRAAVRDLDETIREIRSTIFALQSPAPVAGDGIRGAVLALTHAYGETLGFEPGVSFSGPVDTLITAGVAEQMLAVLRELLSNVAKHAQATSVNVELEADADGAELRVRDNGVGLKPDTHRSGLANMASRAAGLGGSFEASGNGNGTTAVWRVPLET
jgi:signal transduction histidine kinase